MSINLRSRLNVCDAISRGERRNDIQGLRAIAVLAVVGYHLGYLPNGFLGVDIFFVISGYLITGIIYNGILEDRFSIVDFYVRRARRILPLALFISALTLTIGSTVMLPDDLENLAQSVFATNIFSNNILQAITTKNYWDVANEYKALMHTWSLGIEEQYYFLYPFLFLIFRNKRSWLLPALAILTVLSLALNFFPNVEEHEKFYYLPFRFFELSSGGIAAIIINKRLIHNRYSWAFLVILISMLVLGTSFGSREAQLVVAVVMTVGILVSSNEFNPLVRIVLLNKLMVSLGLISFGLYMWHQPMLVMFRYVFVETLTWAHSLLVIVLTVSLSVVSYLLIEQPLRDQKVTSIRRLTSVVGFVFLASSVAALYVYMNSGVLRDVPELDISKEKISTHMHSAYNARVFDYDKPFESDGRIKVLAVGDSFARDWANVLLESDYKDELDISYIHDPMDQDDFKQRAFLADVIFWSTPARAQIRALGINEKKMRAVGTKNFGVNNGIFYNYSGADYYGQRTALASGVLNANEKSAARVAG